MKNLTHYKKQKKEQTRINACERATENCNAAMFNELKRRIQPFNAASQERWDGMLTSLRSRITPEYRLHKERVDYLMNIIKHTVGGVDVSEAMLDNIIHSPRMQINNENTITTTQLPKPD